MAKVHAQQDAKERAEALEKLKQDVAAKVLQREFRAMKDERKAARTRRRKAPVTINGHDSTGTPAKCRCWGRSCDCCLNRSSLVV